MSQPNRREIAEVSKVSALAPEEVATLRRILAILGFDVETIAVAWGRAEHSVRAAFEHGHGLSGRDLAELCQIIHLRPGVVQKRLNFDETPIRRAKQGRKSTPVPMQWSRPPRLCTEGDRVAGTAFRDGYILEGVSQRVPRTSHIEKPILKQIARGAYPVSFQLIRDVVPAIRQTHPGYHKLKLLERILRAFPPDIRTVEDVFAPATTTTQPPPQEESAMHQARQFGEAFVAAERGADLCSLIETYGLREWVTDQLGWDAEKLIEIRDGRSGVADTSLRAVLDQVPTSGQGQGSREAYIRLQNFVKRGASDRPAPAGKPIVGRNGESWNLARGKVKIAGTVLLINGQEDTVFTRRIFATLRRLAEALNEPLTDFLQSVSISVEVAQVLKEGRWFADADRVDGLLRSLARRPELDLSLAQLCGLEPFELTRTPSTEPELLFAPGDRRVSTMWIRVLRKYRAVHRQFAADYGLTPELEEVILEARIGVPVPVHQYLMYLVDQRLARAENPKLIRAYEALRQMPASQFDERQFADTNHIPQPDWLKGQ